MFEYIRFCLILHQFFSVLCIIPTGEILIQQTEGTLFAAPGMFAANLPDEYSTYFRRLITPDNGTEGCHPVVPEPFGTEEGYYLLVARGGCTFEHKALVAAEIGARGVIIYNSLQGIYQGRNYANPQDYDCDHGTGYIQSVSLPIWETPMPSICTGNPACVSKRCVATNTTTPKGVQVCCAWDMYQSMGADAKDDDNKIDQILHVPQV